MSTVGRASLWSAAPVLVLVACGNGEPAAVVDAPSSPAAVTAPSDAASPDTAAAAPLPPPFSKEQIRDLVGRWRAADSAEERLALYATRFDGVEITATGSVHLPRDAWLDRPVAPELAGLPDGDPEMVVFPDFAVAAWRTAAGAEWSLLWGREDDRAAIVLERRVAPDAPLARSHAAPGKGVWLVLADRYAVLAPAPGETPEGAVLLGDTMAVKPVRTAEVGRRWRWVRRQRLVAVGADGALRPVEIAGFRHVAVHVPHEALRESWKVRGYTEVEAAAQLWRLARRYASVYLVAVLRPARKGTLLVQVDKGHPVEPYSRTALPPGVARSLRGRLARTPQWRSLVVAASQQEGAWPPARPETTGWLFRNPRRPGRAFAVVGVRGGVGCGAFFGDSWALFRRRRGTWSSVGQPLGFFRDGFVERTHPVAAIDVNRDGFPEFVAPGRLYFRDAEGRWQVVSVAPVSDANPC